MSEPRSTFRDFGIIPDKLSPPAEMIRASISRWGVVGEYATTFIISALGVCLTVWFGLWMPWCLSLPGCPAIAATFGLLIYFVTRGDYGTIELRGTTLRATHIYTGRVLERSIDEIESLTTSVNRARRLETVVEEKLFGRVKGVELRFRGGLLPLKVLRKGPAMANAQALIEGIVYRMQERGEIDYEITNFAGKPLLNKIFWKGRPAPAAPKTWVNAIAMAAIPLATMFGIAYSLMAIQEKEKHDLASLPPQEIAISTLIENGPGGNRHVTIVNYQSGGYVWEAQGGKDVWIALFPTEPGLAQRNEIAAVLHSRNIFDDASLNKLLKSGRIQGICSTDRISRWGATLGPKLVKMNGGS